MHTICETKLRVRGCNFLTDETVLTLTLAYLPITESDVTFSVWPTYAAAVFVFTSTKEKKELIV